MDFPLSHLMHPVSYHQLIFLYRHNIFLLITNMLVTTFSPPVSQVYESLVISFSHSLSPSHQLLFAITLRNLYIGEQSDECAT
ncbi:MAG: hypothetical protein FD169_635 [Bacillota bacterium]|nr:MAG: hypothetical protein FD169_635 [Bacillota bacterium]